MIAKIRDFKWSKPRVLIVTFGICLTYVVFTLFSEIPVKLFHVQNFNAIGIVLSSTMLLTGYFVYLFIVPVVLGFRSNYRAYLKAIGVTQFSQKSVLILLAFVGITIVIAIWSGDIHVLFSQKRYVLMDYVEPPLLEELMFRGIIMSLLLRVFPEWFSILWSSLLFSLIHLGLGIVGMMNAFIAAIFVFSILRVQTKNIWSGVFAHFMMIRGLTGNVWIGWEVLEVTLALTWLSKKFRFFDT